MKECVSNSKSGVSGLAAAGIATTAGVVAGFIAGRIVEAAALVSAMICLHQE